MKFSNDLTDKEIWDLFRTGSDSAFEYIYLQYFDKLYNYGCQFTTDTALVEDVLQELFLDLKRRSHFLSGTEKILPYLYTSFRRKLIRQRTKSSRFKGIEEETSFAIDFSVEDQIIADEKKQAELMQLSKGMRELPEKYREIIFLFYFENFTYEEIKEIQGYEHVKSARNLLYKAIKALRKGMAVLLILIIFGLNLK